LANQLPAANPRADAVLFDEPAALDFWRDNYWRRHAAGNAGPALVRRYVALDRLTINNEIAGFKFATVGVLYAVLLAFVIIVVWEKFSDAEANVVREAGAAENLYRLSQGLGDFSGADLRKSVAGYLKAAMADDWPAMDKGTAHAGGAAKQALDAIYRMLSVVNDQRNRAIVAEIFSQLDRITEARRSRLIAAEGAVPNVIWLVLLGGAVVTIAFTFFFGMESLRAQTVMTALLAVLIFSELLVVIVIDRPFTGVKVPPTALADVLADVESQPDEPR
jgi:hypothetical protein